MFIIVLLFLCTFGYARSLSPAEIFTGELSKPGYLFKVLSNYKPYLEIANQNNTNITKQEVDVRTKIFFEIFPDKIFLNDVVKKVLLIERAIASNERIYTNDEVVEEAISLLDLNKKLPTLNTEIQDFLNLHFEMSKSSLLKKSKHIEEVNVIKEQEDKLKSNKGWTKDELWINEKETACLAWLNSKDNCFVPVSEYNSSLEFLDFPTDTSLALAKRNLLESYILKKIRSNKYLEYTNSLDSSEIFKNVTQSTQHKTARKLIKGKGNLVHNQEALLNTYYKYYSQYFKEKEEVTIDIIGSTDSTLLVETLSNIKKSELKNPEKNTKEKTWVRFDEKTLPENLVAPTDTFFVGDISKPFKTENGYFVSKLSNIKTRKKIPFQNAIAQCMYIASMEKFQNLDSILNAKIENYYYANIEEFLTSDTITYRKWLFPNSFEKNEKDLSKFDYIDTTSFSLPLATQKLINSYNYEKQGDSLIGPIKEPYGLAFYKVKKIKKGGIQIPLYYVRNEIGQKFTKIDLSSFEKLNAEVSDSTALKNVLINVGLSGSHYINIMDRTNNYTDEELQKFVEEQNIDISNIEVTDKEIFNKKVKRKIEEHIILKEAEDIENIFRKTQINENLLSRR